MGKKYEATRKLVDRDKRYTLAEAVELLPKLKFTKFDETIDVAARLGVNPKHADQMIRSSCALPHGSAIATPDMMGLVGRLGRILGPRNLMPNPKVGTVTMDVARAVREIKAGRIEFRTEKTGIVHAPVGKMSFGPDKLRENIMSLLDTLQRLKPSTAKGKYFKSIALSSTMGPSVRLDTNEVAALLER
jgi:large subunit ribosomal protein L1